MPNVINSIGYSLGKVHTGMICYLCEMWNEGNRNPLREFLNGLGVDRNLPDMIKPLKEKDHIDLVISDNAAVPKPLIAIEIKVDDHEHWTPKKKGNSEREWQTTAYSKILGKDVEKLFITLGSGEYYHSPYCEDFAWIKLSKMIASVERISVKDKLIVDWLAALIQEQQRQEAAINNNPLELNGWRNGCWNIYVLGHLKNKILSLVEGTGLQDFVDPTTYTHGTGPDTILNFGWESFDQDTFPIYTEICKDGMQRIKISFESKVLFSDQQSKKIISIKLEELFLSQFGEFSPVPSSGNTFKKTKTLLKLDVGLQSVNGISFTHSAEDAASKVVNVLKVFNEDSFESQVQSIIC